MQNNNLELLFGRSDNSEDEQKLNLIQKNKKEHDALKKMALPILAAILVCIFLFSLLCVIPYDPVYYSISFVIKYITQNWSDFIGWIFGNDVKDNIYMRTIQYLIITVVGAGLAAAGAMYKSIFRNVLAAPTTMGVQEGGIMANLLFIALFGGSAALSSSKLSSSSVVQSLSNLNFVQYYGQTVFVFAGCFIGVTIVVIVATTAGRGTLSTSAIVLTGTVVNGAIAGITGAVQYDLIMYSNDDDLLKLLMNITMGTFETSYMRSELIVLVVTLLPCIIIAWVLAPQMNLFSLGDEEASGAGLNVKRFKYFIIFLGTFMTAVTMIYCGHISFVGFIVPQITIKLVGADFRKLLPASALIGASFMLVIYDVAKFTGMRDGLSIFTSFIGGIMLIYALMKAREVSHE